MTVVKSFITLVPGGRGVRAPCKFNKRKILTIYNWGLHYKKVYKIIIKYVGKLESLSLSATSTLA